MKLEIPSKVSDIMTRKVVSVDENETLFRLLSSLKVLRFRHLPVTDDERLIGLLTETDLLGIASSNLLPNQEGFDRALVESLRVHDIMVRDVLTVSPDTPLQEAAKRLLKQRVGCLPVVDANNVLVGILTGSDFIKVVAYAAAGQGYRPPDESQTLQ